MPSKKFPTRLILLPALCLCLLPALAFAADTSTGGSGLFSALVASGLKIFSELRDLIYIVAGFGIVAVGVGGIFGNLNWKWLGAILISLVVMATAGGIVQLMTGGKTFGVSNTLSQAGNDKEDSLSGDMTKYAPNEKNWEDTLKKSNARSLR
ncbi:MAG: hypothetical protein IJ184_06865 [Alphaproteobacteria bacterium]|nr:hypothetical protein [Alphaproteobacteria bacterium]